MRTKRVIGREQRHRAVAEVNKCPRRAPDFWDQLQLSTFVLT